MREAGLAVIWRCHIGVDRPNNVARGAWNFLRPYVADADAYVFSRREYLWEGLDAERAWFMPPVIDPFSPKNEDLDAGRIAAVVWPTSRRRRRSVEEAPLPGRRGGSSPRSPAGTGSRTPAVCWKSSSTTWTIPPPTSSSSVPTARG